MINLHHVSDTLQGFVILNTYFPRCDIVMFLFLAIIEVIIIHISAGVQLESILGPCYDLYDQVSKYLFSVPPQQQSTGGPTADASVSVRVHVVEAVFTPAEVASKLNRWLEKQRQAKELSLQDVWLEKTGINLVNDVKFRIYCGLW